MSDFFSNYSGFFAVSFYLIKADSRIEESFRKRLNRMSNGKNGEQPHIETIGKPIE